MILTLVEIEHKLQRDQGIALSIATIHNHLECQFYTIKKVLPQPVAINSIENKTKRAAYVTTIMEKMGLGKTVIYIDETNCNLFLRRNYGRSKKGARCSVRAPTSKGKNIHVIGGKNRTGLIYLERRRGSYKKDNCCDFIRFLLRQVQDPMNEVVIVWDNAPVHVNIGNPIEECWSVFKIEIKKLNKNSLQYLLSNPIPEGTTQTFAYLFDH